MKIKFRGGYTCECVGESLPLVEALMLKRRQIKRNIDIFQLGYRGDVEASKGTHDRGGSVDVAQETDAQIQTWRECGWTQQRRNLKGVGEHGHGWPYRCPHLSAGAKAQERDWDRKDAGLSGGARVTGKWPVKPWQDAVHAIIKKHPGLLGKVNVPELADAIRDGRRVVRDMRRLQLRLTEVGCYTGPVDGIPGPKTKAAYAKWQARKFNVRVGHKDADGVPAPESLRLLGFEPVLAPPKPPTPPAGFKPGVHHTITAANGHKAPDSSAPIVVTVQANVDVGVHSYAGEADSHQWVRDTMGRYWNYRALRFGPRPAGPPPPDPPKPDPEPKLPSTSSLLAVDYSRVQGENFRPPKDAVLAIIKATEGVSITNRFHHTQVRNARAAGVVVGHYHYAHKPSARDNLRYFLDFAQPEPGDVLALDWENNKPEDLPSSSYKDEWLQLAAEECPRNRVLLYCNFYVWRDVDRSGRAGDGLWVADYRASSIKAGASPTPKRKPLLWQYSDADGLDKNRAYFPSRQALEDWATFKTHKR